MHPAETWLFRFVVVAFGAVFAAQVATRLRLFLRAPDNIRVPDAETGARIVRLVREVVFQSRTIRERPMVGLGHLGVFWGFCAFAGFTTVEFLRGLGLADFTGTPWFRVYAWMLVPFSLVVLAGIIGLLIRRVFVRPPALGDHL